MLSLCSGHPSHEILGGGGTHLSHLLRLNLEAVRTLHWACSVLQPSGYDLTAFDSTLFMALGRGGTELNIDRSIVINHDLPQYLYIWG